jgi:hypothetical protein
MDDTYFNNNSDNGCDTDNSNKNESQGGSGSMPANFFYTESCRKTKNRRTNNLLQLVLVGTLFSGLLFLSILMTFFCFSDFSGRFEAAATLKHPNYDKMRTNMRD